MSDLIKDIKELRVAQDKINRRIKTYTGDLLIGEEAKIALRRGKEVRHWLGECLGGIRDGDAENAIPPADIQHPYPDGDDPSNNNIAPTADVAEDDQSGATPEGHC